MYYILFIHIYIYIYRYSYIHIYILIICVHLFQALAESQQEDAEAESLATLLGSADETSCTTLLQRTNATNGICAYDLSRDAPHLPTGRQTQNKYTNPKLTTFTKNTKFTKYELCNLYI